MSHTPQDNTDGPDLADLRLLMTAEEAFPALERAFLEAEREIWASFRVFDLETKLRSDEARAVGDTWFDLVVHVLNKGVSVHVALADFDPILKTKLHTASWKARRAFIGAAEVAGPGADLDVLNATHSARVGLLPRLLLWPALIRNLNRRAGRLNALAAEDRARELECSPGLVRWLRFAPGGTLVARKWPPPPLVPGTHHHKIAVFDRSLLYIGGLDLDERRYDDKGHDRRREQTWHDVQLTCRGSIAEEGQRHLETFLQVCNDRTEPPTTGRLLRTLSRRRRIQFPFLGPRPLVDELARAHLRMIGEARDLIYLETQFFRDRRIAGALARAGKRRSDLGLILILPGAPEDVAFDGAMSSDARFGEYLQARCVDEVAEAFGSRAAICSPVRPERISASGRDTLCGSPIVYVHAKVGLFDDDRAIVSSANLNGRSLSWDTEAGLALDRPEHVARLRNRAFRHWLGEDADSAFFDLSAASGHWRARARSNAERPPERRQGFLVPYDPEPARAFGRPLPGMPHAMV